MTDNDQRITVNARQLEALLNVCIPRRWNVLVTGAPGIGKTAIVQQTAKTLGHKLVVTHAAVKDSTDAGGFPVPSAQRDHVHYIPIGEMAQVVGATQPTVWFIDDFGQADTAVQKGYMQLLHGRVLNGQRIPECVAIIVATNRREDKAGVSTILEPVKSRFHTVVELAVDANQTIDFMLQSDFAPEVVGFLGIFKNLIHDFRPTTDLTNSPCPRAWEYASDLIKAQLPRSIEFPALCGTVGVGAATQLRGWLDHYRGMPDPALVWKNPDTAPIPSDNPQVLHAYATALAYGVTAETAPQWCVYANRLHAARQRETCMYLLRATFRRDKGLTKLPCVREQILAGQMRTFIQEVIGYESEGGAA